MFQLAFCLLGFTMGSLLSISAVSWLDPYLDVTLIVHTKPPCLAPFMWGDCRMPAVLQPKQTTGVTGAGVLHHYCHTARTEYGRDSGGTVQAEGTRSARGDRPLATANELRSTTRCLGTGDEGFPEAIGQFRAESFCFGCRNEIFKVIIRVHWASFIKHGCWGHWVMLNFLNWYTGVVPLVFMLKVKVMLVAWGCVPHWMPF